MERDFLGLSDKQYMSNVKHEVDDDRVGERGLSKKTARQWGTAKLLPNSNFMSATDFQESSKAFPGSYHWGSVSAASILRRGGGHFGGAFQNANPLLLGGSVPLTNHHSSLRPAFNSSVDPRGASSGSSPQLTIFYGGTVSVFNDISPDKAQAIMFCAGNGMKGETGESSLKKEPVRESEKVYGKQIHNAAAAASSTSATHTDNFSRCRDKPVAATTNAMSMIESFNAGPGNMIPSVPQARKASLARFLEKRKERLMSAMPYKKMLLDLSTADSSASHT